MGDEGVVNCVLPHPKLPFIASSGLDNDVKLWSVTSRRPDSKSYKNFLTADNRKKIDAEYYDELRAHELLENRDYSVRTYTRETILEYFDLLTGGVRARLFLDDLSDDETSSLEGENEGDENDNHSHSDADEDMEDDAEDRITIGGDGFWRYARSGRRTLQPLRPPGEDDDVTNQTVTANETTTTTAEDRRAIQNAVDLGDDWWDEFPS